MITKRPVLFFDIETCANPENLALMPEPKAPGNLKDPAKIAAAIEEKKAELIANAALDPDYGKVLSIGYAFGADRAITVTVAGDKLSEERIDLSGEIVQHTYTLSENDLIEDFWDAFASCRGNCVGYNILGFDLPYLMRRSMYLGVKVPIMPALARYRVEPVTDLMMILCNWDTYKAKGLKQVARLLGIPNDCPDADGSQVKGMAPEQLRAYQVSDVKLNIALFERMNGVYFNL